MSYFIPSSIQKRLLRYALSRLELLDTDALDLEKLDIGWGRKSTVELRDVGLRKAKLAALLDLPDNLELLQASVLLLRVTVPADIHTSSIIVEVNGVEAVLDMQVQAEDAGKSSDLNPENDPTFPRSIRSPKTFKSSRLPPISPGGASSFSSSDDGDDSLPTAHDLATSFLAEEPAEGKQQLEAALASQSVDLRQSSISSGSGDSESNAGVGMGFGLPGFLAAFFKGIGDRLQVHVNNVALKLKLPSELSKDIATEALPTPTFFVVHVKEIELQKVGPPSTSAENSSQVRDDSVGGVSQTGDITEKRNVVFKDIFAALLSGPELPFLHDEKSTASYDTTTAASTDASNQVSQQAYNLLPRDMTESLRSSNPLLHPSESIENLAEHERTTPWEPIQSGTASPFDNSSPFPLDPGTPEAYTNASSRHEQLLSDLDNAIQEQSTAYNRFDVDDELAISFRDSKESHSTQIYNALREFRADKPVSSSSSLRYRSRNSRSPSPQYSSVIEHDAGPSVARLRIHDRVPALNDGRELTSSPEYSRVLPYSGVPNHDLQPDSTDPLVRSMLFSSKQAESLYMSAVDEAGSVTIKPDEMKIQRIPGAWDDAVESTVLTSTIDSHPKSKSGSTLGNVVGNNLIDAEHLQIDSDDIITDLLGRGRPTRLAPESFKILARKIFELDRIELSISSVSTTGEVAVSAHPEKSSIQDPVQSRLDQSLHEPLPGSFSFYAESKSARGGFRIASSTSKDRDSISAKPRSATAPFYDILMHSIQCKLDVTTSRIFAELAKIISKRDCATATGSIHSETGPSKRGSHPVQYSIKLRKLEMRIVESLHEEYVHVTNSGSYEFGIPAENGSDIVILVSKLKNLELRSVTVPQMLTTIELGKLYFGFPDEDIISFSRQAKMRSSMRDLQAPHDKDICVTITSKVDILDIVVATKPMKILCNLQKLDHVLGWVGGLSELMESELSTISEATVTTKRAKAQHKSRTVHFDTNLRSSLDPTPKPGNRLSARLGGLNLLLQGKDVVLQYQTSAIKLISRDTVLGIQIDEMRFAGPFQGQSSVEAPLRIRVRDANIKYLFRAEERDLTRLISLLTPSKDKFEDDDDFLVDTLIRQRRKGAVLRTNVSSLEVEIDDLEAFHVIQRLSLEMSKISAMTKYLPEESRPGLMTLGSLSSIHVKVQTGLPIGTIATDLKLTEFAHISFPSLTALSLGRAVVNRNETEPLLSAVLPLDDSNQPPMLMARMIGDELEPTVKIKLWNFCIEYSVQLALALMNLPVDATQEDLNSQLASSIAALTEHQSAFLGAGIPSSEGAASGGNAKPLALDLAFRDCAVGLTPRGLPSKALWVLTDARISGALPTSEGFQVFVNVRKGTILIIDDVRNLQQNPKAVILGRSQAQTAIGHNITDLCKLGFVSVGSISAASVTVKVLRDLDTDAEMLDIELKDELFLLETCADSTQTLLDTLNALKPPMRPSKGTRYRTEVGPVEDMMESFTGDAFAVGAEKFARETEFLDDDLGNDFDDLSDVGGIEPNGQPALGYKYRGYPFDEPQNTTDARHSDKHVSTTTRAVSSLGATQFSSRSAQLPHVTGNKWDSTNNRYIPVTHKELASCPIQLRVRDSHFIWNLYDGYDWEKTRATITKAVQVVEAKAEERRLSRRKPIEEEDEQESLIGDFLFNSIYIGIPVNQDPKDLTRQINRNMDDVISETASHTSTVTSRPSSSHRTPRSQSQRLKLERSKRHKVVFELREVTADLLCFPAGGETQTSLDVKITDFEIFDHIHTSTWKKFATYMSDSGPRVEGKPMVHLEICDVRPVPELTATELVIRITVLPLRLHVDQDTLDFITRFFEFKDDSRITNDVHAEQPYLQRVEVRAVPVKLDYKPKKVDFAGLRSGRTTEFMNFFSLDCAEMVMKHTIVYGVLGFDKLHRCLEDIWMPDIKRNQLPSVLSGLNGVRTLVNVGTGVKDLIVIPVREYKKDGRIVRSVSKGAAAFAKTTGGELTRFGARLAVGAQNALQGAEDFLTGTSHQRSSNSGESPGWDSGDLDDEERRAISHYANQPANILQGLKGAARSLERDLLVTKDVIVAISGEVRESGTAEGAARAMVRHAPTLILRPMIGASKAISQTLMGATNSVDPQNRKRIEDKYKRY